MTNVPEGQWTKVGAAAGLLAALIAVLTYFAIQPGGSGSPLDSPPHSMTGVNQPQIAGGDPPRANGLANANPVVEAHAPSTIERIPAKLIGRWKGSVDTSNPFVVDITIHQADLGESVGSLTITGPPPCKFATALLDAADTYIQFSAKLITPASACYGANVRLDLIDDQDVQYAVDGRTGVLRRYAV